MFLVRSEKDLTILKSELGRNLCQNLSPLLRPVSVHPPLRPDAGVRREEPRRVHDGAAARPEDEAGLDAHRKEAFGTLRRR